MKRVSKHLLAVAMLLFLGATVCSANLISYSTWPARRDKLMVMDENGGNPVELLVMSKGSFPTGGSISPAGSRRLPPTKGAHLIPILPHIPELCLGQGHGLMGRHPALNQFFLPGVQVKPDRMEVSPVPSCSRL